MLLSGSVGRRCASSTSFRGEPWGCGAYGNDPQIVAQAFKNAIDEQSGSIERVVFAIYTRKAEDSRNLEPFRDVFGV